MLDLSFLEERRKALGMPVSALARRSGVARPTVDRILHRGPTDAATTVVTAIAASLGLSEDLIPLSEPGTFVAQQAEKKAKYLVGMVQGTMSLEAQGLPQRELDRMIEETKNELIRQPKRLLWG